MLETRKEKATFKAKSTDSKGRTIKIKEIEVHLHSGDEQNDHTELSIKIILPGKPSFKDYKALFEDALGIISAKEE